MIGWGGGVSFSQNITRGSKAKTKKPPDYFWHQVKSYCLCHFIQCWERGKLLKEEQQTTTDQTCPFNGSLMNMLYLLSLW